MKPHAHISVEHTGNTDGQRVQMSLDASSLTHLMSVLTDLYSDAVLAVIREYATNALDAHRAVGNTAPIEVSLPTSIDPIYRVTDHGIGMSVDDLLNTFSLYGASTKRDTDEAVGMLGLGCKSALTYTSQFTVVASKGGVTATVLVARGSDGVGTVEVVDTAADGAPDGVEIQVPVTDHEEFDSKARAFFAYWEPGTVLLDGQEPSVLADALQVSEDTWVRPGVSNGDVIVQGNVPYPVDYGHRLNRSYNETWSAVVRVPIGSVAFTPSREALAYTEATVEVLDQARDYVRQALLDRIQQIVDQAPTFVAAAKIAGDWNQRNLTYRGESLRMSIRGSGWTYKPYARKAKSFDSSLLLARLPKHLVVNYDRATLTPKVRLQLAARFPEADTVHVIEPSAAVTRYLEGAEGVVDFSEIAAINVSVPRTARSKGYVDVYEPAMRRTIRTADDDLPADTRFVLVRSTSDNGRLIEGTLSTDDAVLIHRRAQTLLQDVTLVIVPNRSQKRFAREHEVIDGSSLVLAAAQQVLLNNAARIPEILAPTVRTDTLASLRDVKVGDVIDPDLVTYLTRSSERDDVLGSARVAYRSLFNSVPQSLRLALPEPSAEVVADALVESLKERYPILSGDRWYLRQVGVNESHLVEIVNALYLARQTEAPADAE